MLNLAPQRPEREGKCGIYSWSASWLQSWQLFLITERLPSSHQVFVFLLINYHIYLKVIFLQTPLADFLIMFLQACPLSENLLDIKEIILLFPWICQFFKVDLNQLESKDNSSGGKKQIASWCERLKESVKQQEKIYTVCFLSIVTL